MARGSLALGVVFALCAGAMPARAANPSLSDDFTRIMEWMSQELAHGIAFNAGSTFDPPTEVRGPRLLPDITLGVGSVPLDKGKFPAIQATQLRDMGAANIFPSKVLFPNLVMHLRMGLPAGFDLYARAADATTPSNYEINPGVYGKAQSNSIGFGLRKHFHWEDFPVVTVGANYNHVLGGFTFRTAFKVNDIMGFSADSDVKGDLDWNVNSFGLNTVFSQTFGSFTPFVGAGYNYATGSLSARLSVASNTPVIAPIAGSSSRKPEPDQARFILGTEWKTRWVDLFANGEVKALGEHSGESWIINLGFVLPFRIGPKSWASSEGERKKERPVQQMTEDYRPSRKAAELQWDSPAPEQPQRPAKPKKPSRKGKTKPRPKPVDTEAAPSGMLIIQ